MLVLNLLRFLGVFCSHWLGFPISSVGSVVTPLDHSEFRRELADHPDQSKVQYVCDGILHGFRTGFRPELVSFRFLTRNLKSAGEQPQVVDKYLQDEIAKGRVAGPFATLQFSNLHCSLFGVIPKKHQPGKWRLILNLSSPTDHSDNDGIPRDQYSLHYISVDTAIRALLELGPGAEMAKFDVEVAYRNIPIHPDDQRLLGMFWRDIYFVDLTLPFGLRSAPFIFDSVADLVERILKHNYSLRYLHHYLDDYITLGPAHSQECARNVNIARAVFMGITSVVSSAGVGIFDWRPSSRVQSHPPGRSFLRRMINLLCCFHNILITQFV